MAHEIDMSNQRANMAFTGEAPWHNLGNSLPKTASLEVWAKAAGLEWTANVCDLITSMLAGNKTIQIPVEGHKALVRSDTHAVLSVVSKMYKPVQPADILGFFKDIVEGLDAGFRMETAGCLKGGAKIWGLAKAEANSFFIGKKDKIDQYLLLATSFDRSLPTVAQLTSTRVVCANTLRVATDSRDNCVRVTHNSTFDGKSAKEQLGIVDQWAKFAADCKRFAEAAMTKEASEKYFANVLSVSNPNHEASWFLTEEEDKESIENLLQIRDHAPGQAEAKGTLWGDLNAVTYWIDHEVKAKSRDNRLNSAWFGRGNRVKNYAFNEALALVG